MTFFHAHTLTKSYETYQPHRNCNPILIHNLPLGPNSKQVHLTKMLENLKIRAIFFLYVEIQCILQFVSRIGRSERRGENTIFHFRVIEYVLFKCGCVFIFRGVSWYGLRHAYNRVGIVNFFCRDSDMGLLTRAHRNSV